LEPARRREYGKWTPEEEETFFAALKVRRWWLPAL
jgi:hypothetical protein